MPWAKSARHESKKQVKFECVDIYVPNGFLVGELAVVRGDFAKEKSVQIISPFVRLRGHCHRKKFPETHTFFIIGFSNLKKRGNFHSIRL